jgi:type IV pilus assembly protein PilB
MAGKLGQILLEENLITPDQLKQALEHQRGNGGRLGNSLVRLGFLSDDGVMAVLSRQFNVPSINLAGFEVDPAVTKLIPMETALKYQVLPLSRVGSSLTLAMVDPTNVFAMDDIMFMTGFNIEPVGASETAVAAAIKRNCGSVEEDERKRELEEIVSFIDEGEQEALELEAQDESTLNLEELEKAAEEAPVIKLVNYFLTDAVKRGASDIHNLMRKIGVAMFTRTLGTLITSGVPMLEAMDITARTTGNAVVEKAVLEVRKAIETGRTIVDPLRETGVFPDMVVQMIGVGE